MQCCASLPSSPCCFYFPSEMDADSLTSHLHSLSQLRDTHLGPRFHHFKIIHKNKQIKKTTYPLSWPCKDRNSFSVLLVKFFNFKVVFCVCGQRVCKQNRTEMPAFSLWSAVSTIPSVSRDRLWGGQKQPFRLCLHHIQSKLKCAIWPLAYGGVLGHSCLLLCQNITYWFMPHISIHSGLCFPP